MYRRAQDQPDGVAEPEARIKATKKVEVAIGRGDKAQLVSDAIAKVSESLVTLQVKPTLAEFLKLIELAEELGINTGEREVQVKWIDPDDTWLDEA